MNNKKSTLITFLENLLIGDGFLCCFSILLFLILRGIFEKEVIEPALNFLHFIALIYGTVFIIILIVYLIIKANRRNRNNINNGGINYEK